MSATEVVIGGIDEAIVTWEDEMDDIADLLKEMEEIFKRPDEFAPQIDKRARRALEIFETEPEFHDPKKLSKIRPAVKIGTSTRRLASTIECVGGLARACYAAILVEIAARVATEVLEEPQPTRRKRRKTKTLICVRACLDIIDAAKRDVFDGYALHRALETEASTVKRYRRKFKSRA